jgi:hypothetical protein
MNSGEQALVIEVPHGFESLPTQEQISIIQRVCCQAPLQELVFDLECDHCGGHVVLRSLSIDRIDVDRARVDIYYTVTFHQWMACQMEQREWVFQRTRFARLLDGKLIMTPNVPTKQRSTENEL